MHRPQSRHTPPSVLAVALMLTMGVLTIEIGFAQPAPQALPTPPASQPGALTAGAPAAQPGAGSPASTAQGAPLSGSGPGRQAVVPGAPCLLAEFRRLALDTHDPTERERVIRQWLRANLQGCSLEKLTLIGSNRAAWLGTADSPIITGKIDTAIEAKVQDNPALLAQLFDATPRSFTPSVETIRTEPARPILGSPGGGFGFLAPMGVIHLRPGDGHSTPYSSPGGSPWLEPPVQIRPHR